MLWMFGWMIFLGVIYRVDLGMDMKICWVFLLKIERGMVYGVEYFVRIEKNKYMSL